MKVIIRPIAILVAHSLIMAQLTTGQPATVAFAGVKVENVELIPSRCGSIGSEICFCG